MVWREKGWKVQEICERRCAPEKRSEVVREFVHYNQNSISGELTMYSMDPIPLKDSSFANIFMFHDGINDDILS